MMKHAARKLIVTGAAAALAATAGVAIAATPSSAAGTNAPTNHVYTATSFYIQMGRSERKVVAVNVPAGSYTVEARMNPFFGDAGVDQFSCDLLEPGGGLVDNTFTTLDATNGFASSTMTLVAAFSSASPGTVRVGCLDSTAHGQMGRNTLVVTQVGSVEQQR